MSNDNAKHLQQFSRTVTLPYVIDERIKLRNSADCEYFRPKLLKAAGEHPTGKKARYYERPAFCTPIERVQKEQPDALDVTLKAEPAFEERENVSQALWQAVFKGCA